MTAENKKCSECGGPLGRQTWTVNGREGIYCSESCFATNFPELARQYGMVPQSIDQLIEWFATDPTHPSVADNSPIVLYRCDQEGYDIYYAPSLGEATYRFDTGAEVKVDHLNENFVDYYEKSGYWKKL